MEKCYSNVLFFRIFRFAVGCGGEVFFYMDFIVLDQMCLNQECRSIVLCILERLHLVFASYARGRQVSGRTRALWDGFLVVRFSFFYYPHTQMERQSLEQLFGKEDTLRG